MSDEAKTEESKKLPTLREMGAQLPIGILGPSGFNKSFKLKPFRLKEEKELARALAKAKDLNSSSHVSVVLATLVESVGEQKLSELKEDKRAAFFSALYACDVFYMYLLLRLEALGKDVRMRVGCRSCQEAFDFVADLGSIEIAAVTAPKEITTQVDLAHGLTYRGKVRETVAVKPPLWNTMETVARDPASATAQLLQACISGVKDVAEAEFSPVPDAALDELTKLDVEKISKAINDFSPGPRMAVEADCPKCNRHCIAPITWVYESFFSHSSL